MLGVLGQALQAPEQVWALAQGGIQAETARGQPGGPGLEPHWPLEIRRDVVLPAPAQAWGTEAVC